MSYGESYALPEDPALGAFAAALAATGHWGFVVDERWRLAWASDDLRLSFGAMVSLAPFAIGEPVLGPAWMRDSTAWRMGPNELESNEAALRAFGPLMLADLGREGLLAALDPVLHGLVDQLEPVDAAVHAATMLGFGIDADGDVPMLAIRIHDAAGGRAGTAVVSKPAAGMATLGWFGFGADLAHVERMVAVSRAGRRPAAILFADLEGSSPLARRLPTAAYFALGRRLVRAADRCVVDAGGLVGRHVGDGVVGFFLAETAGSESAAARQCIAAARDLRAALAGVAAQSDLALDDVAVRFGLHWGATLFVGNITTPGRSEINALGDEVNEAARIEACATGGRMLASKALVERLDAADAQALGLDPSRVAYTALADLDGATEKARRDAPAIAVCEL